VPFIGFYCWPAASQENKAASQPGRASHRPSASSKQQQSEACSRQQAAAGSRPASRQPAEGRQRTAQRASSQPAAAGPETLDSHSAKSQAREPSKASLAQPASAQVRTQCKVACGWHAPASGIRPAGRHPSDKQASNARNQKPETRTHKKIRQEVSGLLMCYSVACMRTERARASQPARRTNRYSLHTTPRLFSKHKQLARHAVNSAHTRRSR